MSENTLLDKLEGLSIRFEEVGTLITDPAVISDMKRFVKLTKEYSDLEKIVKAKNQYEKLLNNISEARSILESENDLEIREMAKEELAVSLGFWLFLYFGQASSKFGRSQDMHLQ